MRTETSNKVFILMEKYGMSNIPFFNYYVLFYKKNHQRCSTCPTQEVGVDGGCLIRTTCINEDR